MRIACSWGTGAVILLALLFRIALLASGAYSFNSDEAIVALMARHTLQGNWPTFFYGQAYMGSLDATLVALGFKLLGQHIWVIRLVQLILYCGVVLTAMHLSRRLSKSNISSLITGLLLAIPTVNLNLYTTVSLGGYGEALLIGNLILWLALVISERPRAHLLYPIWGFLVGLGFWAFGLTLIYVLPAFVYILIKVPSSGEASRSRFWNLWIGAGFLAGVIPIIYWVGKNGIAPLIGELLGSAIAGTSGTGYWESVGDHIINFLVFGSTVILGMRPPWSINIFFWPLALLVCLFWIAVVTQVVRAVRGRSEQPALARMLGAVILTLVAGFVLTPFGGDPSGRYFVPVTVMLSILAGLLFTSDNAWFPRPLTWALFTAVVIYHLSSNLNVAIGSRSGFSTQFDQIARIDHTNDEELIRFLSDEEETRGYTNYWVAYPLAFKSNEQLIYFPQLPYHLDFRFTSRDSRYAPYEAVVKQSRQVAYITTKHPELDEKIRHRLKELEVAWKEKNIGDFHVFYDFSRHVEPREIDERFQ